MDRRRSAAGNFAGLASCSVGGWRWRRNTLRKCLVWLRLPIPMYGPGASSYSTPRENRARVMERCGRNRRTSSPGGSASIICSRNRPGSWSRPLSRSASMGRRRVLTFPLLSPPQKNRSPRRLAIPTIWAPAAVDFVPARRAGAHGLRPPITPTGWAGIRGRAAIHAGLALSLRRTKRRGSPLRRLAAL